MESTTGYRRKSTSRKTVSQTRERGEFKSNRRVKAVPVRNKGTGTAIDTDSVHEVGRKIWTNFIAVYLMDPVERIDLIEGGVEPAVFTAIAKSMQRSKESFGRLMGMPASTVARKLQKSEPFSTSDSERLVAAAKLIGQIESMVRESGDLEGFDAAQWFNQWLDKPLHALNNRPPADFMSTAEGRELLSRLLASAQSGAYA